MSDELETRAAALVRNYGMKPENARRYAADLMAQDAEQAEKRAAGSVVFAAEMAIRDATCSGLGDDGYPCRNLPGSRWAAQMCEACGERWKARAREMALASSSMGLPPVLFDPGDLVIWSRRHGGDRNEVARVVEVRWVPEADWNDDDRTNDGKVKTPHPVYVALEYPGEAKPIHIRIPGGYAWSWAILGPHHAICAECRQPWPCDHSRQEWAIREFARKLEEVCRHCGKSVQGCSYITVSGPDLDTDQPGTIWFHTRKRGGCRAAAAAYETRLVEAGRISRRSPFL